VLARQAVRWVKDHGDRIAERDPEMPAAIINRAADNWRALLAIADEAEGRWPRRARKAATMSHDAEGDESSRLEILLGDIQTISKGEREMPSADLVKALIAIEGRPWAEMGKARKPLTQNGLARMLKPLKIRSEDIWIDSRSLKGYVFRHFEEAFARYLPPEGVSKPRERENADETGTSDLFQTARRETDLADRKCDKPTNGGHPRGLADEKGGSGEEPWHLRYSDQYHGPVVAVPEHPPDPLDEHGESVTPPGLSEAPGTGTSVPFMLTNEMRRRLRVCGYSDQDINTLTPQRAWEILAAQGWQR
jgi:hypothetical protein